MFNLRYALWTEDGTSAYLELAQLVAAFGMENILYALAEISKEQYTHKIRVEDGVRFIIIDGKEYKLP